MIREYEFEDDVIKTIKASMDTQTAFPWNEFQIHTRYPDIEKLESLENGYIWIATPILEEDIEVSGSSTPLGNYTMEIGFWNDLNTGGMEMHRRMIAATKNYFKDSAKWGVQTFDITLDQLYEDTTLLAQGIGVDAVDGPFVEAPTNKEQFRSNIVLTLII